MVHVFIKMFYILFMYGEIFIKMFLMYTGEHWCLTLKYLWRCFIFYLSMYRGILILNIKYLWRCFIFLSFHVWRNIVKHKIFMKMFYILFFLCTEEYFCLFMYWGNINVDHEIFMKIFYILSFLVLMKYWCWPWNIYRDVLYFMYTEGILMLTMKYLYRCFIFYLFHVW